MRSSFRLKLTTITSLLLILAFGVALFASTDLSVYAATSTWPTFLGNNGRSGFNAGETHITTQTAPQLKLHWKNQAGGQISTQPVEANGLIYWGSWDGIEHATNPTTGVDSWAKFLGQTAGNCITQPHGVLSTATVANVTIGGTTTPVVFVGGGDVQLYALNATTGAIIWHTSLGVPPDSFLYSATTVYKGSVYIGVSSLGDCPLVQGKIVQVNASTGIIQHTFPVVASSCLGGGVWGSPTIDAATGLLYFGTGNGGTCSTTEPNAVALVVLRTSNLSFVSSWQVPPSQLIADSDFGTTPTLFTATIGGILHQMVGLENKNGIYYAFDRANVSAGPLWQVQIAIPPSPTSGSVSISSSAFDGTTLYVAGASTTINGTSCGGGLRALNPASGAFLWEDCESTHIFSPVMVVPGVVVVGNGPTLTVVNAANGGQLFTFTDTTKKAYFYGAATIINGVLYQGNMDGILYAFGS